MNQAEILKALKAALQALYDLLPSLFPPPEAPKSPPQAPKPPDTSISRFTAFRHAIRKHEGWGKPGSTIGGVYYPNGTRSYRNNNPGNCKYSRVGYHPQYGVVGKDADGFAIFKTYELGWLYMTNLARGKIEEHPAWTLYDFFADPEDGWAPRKDRNDPLRYATAVAHDLGCSIDLPVTDLLK